MGNIVVITKNTCYFTLHRVWNIDLHNAENSISRPLDFKIFWGHAPLETRPSRPDPSRGSRLRRSYLTTPLNKYCCQYEHPSKNLSYGPETYSLNFFLELPFGLLSILDLNTIFLSELLNFTYIDLLFFALVFAGASMMATETQTNTQSIHLYVFIPIWIHLHYKHEKYHVNKHSHR